jgi:transcriptional regulator with XRE-family HTH domain
MSKRKEIQGMWLESVNKKISEKGITIKQIAEGTYMQEKTVKRILTGVSKSPSMANIIAIVQYVGCSLDEVFEIFVGTQAVLGDENLMRLQQECDVYKEELSKLNQEVAELKSKNTELEIELKVAKKEVELKDQIIAVHNHYINFKSNN